METTSTDKPIIGLSEEVQLYLPNGKFIRRDAKIDTGARTTAIDVKVAEALGLGEVYQAFHEKMPKLELNHDNFKEMREVIKKEIVPNLRSEIPGLLDVRVIPATNGVTVRPYVNLTMKLGGIKFDTSVNIVDRHFLLYPVLVGKNDLREFLIDPNKSDYKTA